ncbi:MAG: hypothetical protein RL318_2859 [Fibrobacterota bacterium]
MLAQEEKLPLWEVNLERHPGLAKSFQSMDVPSILMELSLILRTKIGAEPGILFLDEIQSVPAALAALRYFHEERPDLPVIAAGSLLEFALQEMKASMPVGRIEFFHLGPLSFEEYLLAAEGDYVLQTLRDWNLGEPWPETLHNRLSGRLREYLAVGGMPEATAVFLEESSFADVAAVHRSIVETYREDFSKYALGSQTEKVRRIFDTAPAFLGQKIRWSRIHPDWKSVDQRKAFDQLARAGILCPVHHSDGTGLPLDATRDDGVFKLLHLDVGLVQNALGGFALSMEQFLEGRFVNEGPLAEQFTGQQLRFDPNGSRPELHYWLREGKSGNAEVDFLTAVQGTVIPVEVKSGAAGSMRSLHQFVDLRGASRAVRFDLNPPSRQTIQVKIPTASGQKQVEYELISLPLGLAGQMRRLLSGSSAAP